MLSICILSLAVVMKICQAHDIRLSDYPVLPAPAQGGFRYHLLMDEQNYNLTWTFDDTTVTFNVNTSSTGWLALGFAPVPPPEACDDDGDCQWGEPGTYPRGGQRINGGKGGRGRRIGGPPQPPPPPPPKDLVYVWFDASGKALISDRHLSRRNQTVADAKQDYTLIGANKTAAGISATFSRKRFTCDQDDTQFTNDFVHLLWTHGNNVPKSESELKLGQPKQGMKTTYLFSADKLRQFSPITKYEIAVPNKKLLNDFDTFFWCEVRKIEKGTYIPDLLRFDPLIKPGNEGVMHHIYSYTCKNDTMAKYVNKGAECFFDRAKTMRNPIHYCDTNYISSHSITGDVTYYDVPETAKEDTYLRVEFHYFNPNLIQNITDNSKARYYFPSANPQRPTPQDACAAKKDILKECPRFTFNKPPPPPPPPPFHK